ncbi:MAG: DNA/RNA helicase domain-containing protein, partial [Candidatus Nanopelagicaceae bacterium]
NSAWIIDPDSVNEVGCIHTSQGLELDYVGVIIGPDLAVQGGELVTVPSARAKTDKSLHGFIKEAKENRIAAESKADEIIRNTYRTLMSRGMKGCYVHFTDPEVKEYFRSRLPI